jgi:sugar phosphate permease
MYFWPYAISQPFIGLIADLAEPAFILAVALFLTVAGSVVMALGTTFAVACVGRALTGLGSGAVMVPTCKIFANWFTPRYFFIFQGLVLSSGAAGGVLAQGPLAALIDEVSWRSTFCGIAVIGMVVCLLTLLYRGSPEKMGFSAPAALDEPLLHSGEVTSGIGGHFVRLWKNMKKVLSNPHFWTLVLWDALIPGVYYNLSSMWGAMYLEDIFHFSEQKSADIMIYLNIAWIVGTPPLTFLSEFAKTRKWILVGTSVCLLLVCVGFLFIDGSGSADDFLVQFMMFAFGFFGIGPASIAVAMFKEMETQETSGAALGCSNFFPFLSSAILQEVTAYVLELIDRECEKCHTFRGFIWALWIPTLVAVFFGLIGAVLARETFPAELRDGSGEKDLLTQGFAETNEYRSVETRIDACLR